VKIFLFLIADVAGSFTLISNFISFHVDKFATNGRMSRTQKAFIKIMFPRYDNNSAVSVNLGGIVKCDKMFYICVISLGAFELLNQAQGPSLLNLISK
jgi:hypothetical protein